MSRGLGRVEREIVAILESNELFNIHQLVERIYQIVPHEGTDACYVSVRRALRSLLRKGLIARSWVICVRDRGYCWQYANPAYAAEYTRSAGGITDC